jgi:hypothetical protein
LLEGLINLLRLLHFIVHFLPHEGAPELLDLEFVAHLSLALVFALVRGGLGNFLILFLSLDATTDRLLFIPYTALDFREDYLSIMVFLLDIFHELINYEFGFYFLLLDTSAPPFLRIEHLFLVRKSFGGASRLDFLGQEVLLQSSYDVLVLVA